MVLGISVRSLQVKAEDRFSLRGDTLRQALEEDKQKGRKPFILGRCDFLMMTRRSLNMAHPVATVGTTSSGAIDNLSEIKAVGKISSPRFV